jgi:RHS repeat-associated protein
MAALLTTYSAYGAHDATKSTARIAFAGQVREAETGWYLLGERPYSPTLRRFLAPDRLSPFASGGINRYTYCSGDPINRIDPSGNTPLGWGIFSKLRNEASIKGVRGSASSGSGPTGVDGTTPGTLASAVASLADTVSVTSAIVSTSMTSAPPKARGLHGRVGSAPASEGAALPAPRRRKARWEIAEEDDNLMRNRPSEIRHDGIRVLMNAGLPSSRIGAREHGWPYVIPQWSDRIHATNRKSQILAADSITFSLEYDGLIGRMKDLGVRHFTHYSGSHGDVLGRNWDVGTQTNVAPDRGMFERDKTYMANAAKTHNMTIDVVDIGGWTAEQFREAISRDGVHALAMCYGLVDAVVRQEFGVRTVTVYHLSRGAQP